MLNCTPLNVTHWIISSSEFSTPKQGKKFTSRDVFEVQPNNVLTQYFIFLTVGNLNP
jgi:hypothetical protein